MRTGRIKAVLGNIPTLVLPLFMVFASALPQNTVGQETPFLEHANTPLDSPWPMFRHDLKHTGRTPYTGPATPTLAWTFPTTDGIASSPTIGEDDTIYFGAGWNFMGPSDFNLYALNPDGTLKWNYAPPGGRGGFFSSPALGSDSTVYLTSLDGNLYAIQDMGTYGEARWITNLQWDFAMSSPAIGADGTVYVGSPSFKFYAVDRVNGSIKWWWRSGWCIISSPAIGDDGLVYIGSKDLHLYAVDPALETWTWRFLTGAYVDSSPAIGEDGTIYVGADLYGGGGQTPVPVDTSFWAVNPDGTLKWSFDTGDGVESSPAIGPDGTVYFGSYDGYLYAVMDAGSQGVLQWKFLTGDAIDGSPTVDGDGVIYFGSRDSNVYALYPDGTVKWTFPTGDGIECSPTIDDRGYLYIGSMDGNMYALGTGAPDVGVMSVSVPEHLTPETTHVPTATVRNYRCAEQVCDVSCVIDVDETVHYTDTKAVSIPGGASQQVEFAPWTVGEEFGVQYTVTVTTQLPGDDNTDNNEHSIRTVSDLAEGIPTLSGWGVIVLTLLLVTAGSVVIGQQWKRTVS